MDALTLIVTVPAIVAIVTVLKRFGLRGPWTLLAAILVAIALNVGNYYLGTYGGYQAAVEGLILGLAAGGTYDLAKTAAPKL